ncbi:MAG: MlaD family protein [candidate division Zixibacteria bacterium]|nr:MlaD family protein [candidate division Zixibacteria bacterium]
MDYKKMSYISGVIIFFGFGILLLAIIWLSAQNIFFSHNYVLYVRFPEVTGLRDQSPIFMRGYRIGTTKGVKFEPNSILIQLQMNQKFIVPKGSKFEITTLNFIGEKAISITPPPVFAEPMQAYDTVVGENKDIMITAQQVLSKVKSQIEGEDLGSRFRRLGESIDRFHSILGKVDSALGQINIAEYNEQIRNIGQAGKQIQEFLKTSQPEVVNTAQDAREMMAKLDGALDRFSSLATELDTTVARLNQGQGSAGELLTNKEYIENLSATIDELRLLIADIKQNPGRYVKVSIF